MGKTSKSSWVKVLAAALVLLLLWLTLELGASFVNVILPWHRSSAIECALGWGGLAELPSSAKNVKVATTGSAFTRTFEVSFQASEADIRKWIAQSSRLSGATPQRNPEGVLIYEVYPGEKDAMGGWVEIRDDNTVFISMSWS